jgi:predicted phosphoribosyltransferase
MFTDRKDAGERLAEVIDLHDVEADLVVAIPRGGIPIGRIVADKLGVPLGVVVAKKLGAPGNPELAIGAVATDGTIWRNERLITRMGVTESYIETERERVAEAAREKAEQYQAEATPDVAGKQVVVVDDGVATGATMFACVEMLQNAGAERVVVAVPVGSPDSLVDLETMADEVIAVESPPHFWAVGQFYEQFEQVSDDDAIGLLH